MLMVHGGKELVMLEMQNRFQIESAINCINEWMDLYLAKKKMRGSGIPTDPTLFSFLLRLEPFFYNSLIFFLRNHSEIQMPY